MRKHEQEARGSDGGRLEAEIDRCDLQDWGQSKRERGDYRFRRECGEFEKS